MASLANKTALVTGASRGIGRATAEALAKMGARLIVHYGRAAAEADTLVAGMRAAGGRADAAQADLSLPEGAAVLAKQVRALVGQGLDIFVANAGVSKAAALEEHTIADFDTLFATNVRSPFFLVKELLPLFRDGSTSSSSPRWPLVLHPAFLGNRVLRYSLPISTVRVDSSRQLAARLS
jgi:3-oxoacyl-[acyl-carrier protein] reductase